MLSGSGWSGPAGATPRPVRRFDETLLVRDRLIFEASEGGFSRRELARSAISPAWERRFSQVAPPREVFVTKTS